MEKGWINCTLLAYLHISVRVWNLNFSMAKCLYIERDASIITVSITNKWTINLIATFYATDACEITKFNTIEGIFEMSPVKLSIIGPIYRNLLQINFIQPIKLVANFNLTQIMLKYITWKYTSFSSENITQALGNINFFGSNKSYTLPSYPVNSSIKWHLFKV